MIGNEFVLFIVLYGLVLHGFLTKFLGLADPDPLVWGMCWDPHPKCHGSGTPISTNSSKKLTYALQPVGLELKKC